MAVDRRAAMAGGAAALVTALVIWAQSGSAPEGAAPTARPRANARAAAAAQAAGAPVDVRLDLLAAAGQSPADDGRNPFAFRAARQAAAPPPAAAAPPSSGPRLVAPPAPSGPPPPPPIALKFIGIVESANGMKLAVLTDGRVVSHGREGDIIEGRYRILKIGVESIELAHLDGRGRQTIRLTGQ